MCLFLQPETPVFVGLGAHGILTADVNADGMPDVLVADGQSRQVAVLLGDGHGGFSSAEGYVVPAGVGAIVDQGSGYFLALNRRTGALTRLVASHGTFSIVGTLQEGAGTNLVAGDAHGLVAVANRDTDTLSIGQPGTAAQTVLLTAAATSLITADLAGQGLSDVIATVGDSVEVLMNDGGNQFAAPVDYLAAPGAKQVVAADVTGNGRTDLVVLGEQHIKYSFGTQVSVSVLLGDGHGGFGPATVTQLGFAYNGPGLHEPVRIAVGDLTGDGRADLVASIGSNLEVLQSDGQGGFTPEGDVNFSAEITSVAIGDLVPGGRPDILVTLDNGELEVIRTALHPSGGAAGSSVLAPTLSLIAPTTHGG